MAIFNSFRELGAFLNVEPKTNDERAETKKCFKCGGKMTRISGTNVFRCADCKNNAAISNVG